MARRARRTHNPPFKAKVALAAVKDEKTAAVMVVVSQAASTLMRQ
jgi:hypothetical protein